MSAKIWSKAFRGLGRNEREVSNKLQILRVLALGIPRSKGGGPARPPLSRYEIALAVFGDSARANVGVISRGLKKLKDRGYVVTMGLGTRGQPMFDLTFKGAMATLIDKDIRSNDSLAERWKQRQWDVDFLGFNPFRGLTLETAYQNILQWGRETMKRPSVDDLQRGVLLAIARGKARALSTFYESGVFSDEVEVSREDAPKMKLVAGVPLVAMSDKPDLVPCAVILPPEASLQRNFLEIGDRQRHELAEALNSIMMLLLRDTDPKKADSLVGAGTVGGRFWLMCRASADISRALESLVQEGKLGSHHVVMEYAIDRLLWILETLIERIRNAQPPAGEGVVVFIPIWSYYDPDERIVRHPKRDVLRQKLESTGMDEWRASLLKAVDILPDLG